MAYDEEVYEKLLKNFELLCTIIQQNTSGNQMKADITKIEELVLCQYFGHKKSNFFMLHF